MRDVIHKVDAVNFALREWPDFDVVAAVGPRLPRSTNSLSVRERNLQHRDERTLETTYHQPSRRKIV